MLKSDGLATSAPTLYPTVEELSIGNFRFIASDQGGMLYARRIRQDYYSARNGVVYLADASDVERFAEAEYELDQFLELESLARVPFWCWGIRLIYPRRCRRMS